MRGKLALLAVMVAMVLAGCTAVPASLQASSAPSQASAAAAPEDFRVELRGCTEGGGHTVYNERFFLVAEARFAPPEWAPFDVREDVGNPLLATTREPLTGPGHGYYHATVTCDTWTFRGQSHADWVSGHVGIRVEAPPFDPGGADRHYLISTLPFAEADVRAAFAELGYHATNGTGLIEASPWHSVLDDELNGTYTSFNDMAELGPAEDHVVRIWNLVPAGDKWHPMALDMITTHATHIGTPGGGYFTHQHPYDPPPEDPGPFRAFSNVAGLGWTGFDRVIVPGPSVDVLLDHPFVHH